MVGCAVLGAFKKSKRPYWGVMGRQFNIYRVLLDFSDSPTDACIYHMVLLLPPTCIFGKFLLLLLHYALDFEFKMCKKHSDQS